MKTFVMALVCSFLTLAGSAQTTDSLRVSKTPMTDTEFSRLLKDVEGRDLDSLKTNTLQETFVNTNYFNTAQVRKLLTLIAKDSDKLALARSAYDRVTDPGNFVSLADLFNSSVYQREFTLWVNKQND